MSTAPYGTGFASTARTAKRSRAWLVLIPVLLILAIVGVVAYYVLSNFFAANGTWYGPMRVKTGIATVSVETYMNLSTAFTGNISGSGTFCVPLPFNNNSSFDFSVQGHHDFVRPWMSDPQPITLTADYSIPLLLGVVLPLGPQLTLHGNVVNNVLKVSGGNANAASSFELKHGSKADFTAACKSLSPLGFVQTTASS